MDPLKMVAFEAGDYSFLPNVFQYSGCVMALPGFEIMSVRFSRLLPMQEGFAAISAHLASAGRPLTALCACELRSPGQMSQDEFRAFNRAYVQPLTDWGLFRDEVNPVARCNLAPEVDAPPAPGFYGFSYTVKKQTNSRVSFLTGGAADCPEGVADYSAHVIRRGDTSPEGMREKARFALSDLESRYAIMGVSWADVTRTNLYTVHDVRPLLGDEFARRGAMAGGLTWHYCRPPVLDLDIELDARGTSLERVLTV